MGKTLEELLQIPNAAQPTPGQGLVLGIDGQLPLAVRQTLPGYEIGYDQVTGNVTVSSTTEATGTAVISAAAHVFDGSAVMAEFFSEFVNPASAAAAFIVICLFEGTTQIGRLGAVINSAANTMGASVCGRLRFTPTAAPHTYSVTAYQGGGNGVIIAGAGGTGVAAPAFLRFTKV